MSGGASKTPMDQNMASGQMPMGQQMPMGGMPMQTNQPYAMPGQPMGGMGPDPKFASQQAFDQFTSQGGMQGMQDRMGGISGLLGNDNFQITGYDPRAIAIANGGGPGSIPSMSGMPPGGMPPPDQTGMYLRSQQAQQGRAPMTQQQYTEMMSGRGNGNMNEEKTARKYENYLDKNQRQNDRIDGRKLRDDMDITTRRQMGGLPNALGNNMPPSMNRPTQGMN